MPPPEWFLEQPEVLEGDAFYLKAFDRLSTCRPAGAGLGRIPWTASIQYAERAGLTLDMADAFVSIIEAMDGVFLKWHNKNNPPTSTGG